MTTVETGRDRKKGRHWSTSVVAALGVWFDQFAVAGSEERATLELKCGDATEDVV